MVINLGPMADVIGGYLKSKTCIGIVTAAVAYGLDYLGITNSNISQMVALAGLALMGIGFRGALFKIQEAATTMIPPSQVDSIVQAALDEAIKKIPVEPPMEVK